MWVIILVVAILLLVIGIVVPVIKEQKDKPYYSDKFGESPKKIKKKKPKSFIVLAIAWFMLIFSIVGGAIAWIAMGASEGDLVAPGFGVFAGCTIEGLVTFGVLYALGHILRKSEEMNEKMDKMIEIEMWKKENK